MQQKSKNAKGATDKAAIIGRGTIRKTKKAKPQSKRAAKSNKMKSPSPAPEADAGSNDESSSSDDKPATRASQRLARVDYAEADEDFEEEEEDSEIAFKKSTLSDLMRNQKAALMARHKGAMDAQRRTAEKQRSQIVDDTQEEEDEDIDPFPNLPAPKRSRHFKAPPTTRGRRPAGRAPRKAPAGRGRGRGQQPPALAEDLPSQAPDDYYAGMNMASMTSTARQVLAAPQAPFANGFIDSSPERPVPRPFQSTTTPYTAVEQDEHRFSNARSQAQRTGPQVLPPSSPTPIRSPMGYIADPNEVGMFPSTGSHSVPDQQPDLTVGQLEELFQGDDFNLPEHQD